MGNVIVVDVSLELSGVGAAGLIGPMSFWVPVNDDQTPNWTDVDDSQTTTWTQVPTPV